MQREFPGFWYTISFEGARHAPEGKKGITLRNKLAAALSALMLLAILSGCAKTPDADVSTPAPEATAPAQETAAPEETLVPAETFVPEEPTAIRLGGLTGATTMGMAKLLADAENETAQNTYAFTLAASADELTPKLLQGQLDIVAVPVNLAAILYKNTEGKVQLLAVNTLGVLDIVEKGGETIQSMADLAGKTIYATGKGSTPEYALTYLLAQAGLTIGTDVTVEWKTEPAEIVALMGTQDHVIAMMPQPYVTVAQGQFTDLRIALELTDVWDSLNNGSMFITAGLLVRKEFAQTYPQQLATFLEEYEASTRFVNENITEAAEMIDHFGFVKAAVAQKAIPYCNIVYMAGDDMKTAVAGYLQILFEQKPEAVGGAVPGDDFYYAP